MQGPELVGSGASGNAQQGSSVAISADGNTAIVGSPSDAGGVGAAWVWVRGSNDTWTQDGPKLVASDTSGMSFQGWSVAISTDGTTAIVGGPQDNSKIGAA